MIRFFLNYSRTHSGFGFLQKRGPQKQFLAIEMTTIADCDSQVIKGLFEKRINIDFKAR